MQSSSMGTLIDALHQLQSIHSQIADIERRERTKLRDLEHRRKRERQAKQAITELDDALKLQQRRIDEVELEIKTRESSIGKHREELNRARTNREYASILTALNTEKADVAKYENQTLELMSVQDGRRTERASLVAEHERAVERAREAEEALEAYLEKVRTKREQLERERSEAANAIPLEVLRRFERIAEKNEGEALAEVIQPHPKRQEYACGACNMAVTLEQLNNLTTRDEIQVCNVCGSILYLKR